MQTQFPIDTEYLIKVLTRLVNTPSPVGDTERGIELCRELMLLEPCGTDNEEPQFLLRGARVEATKAFGQGAHLELTLREDGKKLRAIWWRMGEKLRDFRAGDWVDLVFVPKPDDFSGPHAVQLVIDDLRLMDE